MENIVINAGVTKLIAVASAKGMQVRPKNNAPIDAKRNPDRDNWINKFFVYNKFGIDSPFSK